MWHGVPDGLCVQRGHVLQPHDNDVSLNVGKEADGRPERIAPAVRLRGPNGRRSAWLASHAREQERGGSTAPRGLQDVAPEDEAVRHLRGAIPAVLILVSRPRWSANCAD